MHKSLDQLSKEIFSINRILTYILKAVISEFKNISVEEISTYLHSNNPNFDLKDNNSKVLSLNTVEANNKTIFDSFYAVSLPDSDGEIAMFVDIEAQGQINNLEDFKSRQNVYVTRMVQEQKDAIKKMEYKKIKKVVSCWIFPNLSGKKREGKIILEPRVKFDYTEGEMRQINGRVDETTLIASIYLGESDNPTIQLLNLLYEKENIEENIRKLKTEYGIEIESEVQDMCTLDEYVRNEGMKTGEARGIEVGKESTMISNLKNLMEKLNISLEEAMNLLSVSSKDKKKYMNLMM